MLLGRGRRGKAGSVRRETLGVGKRDKGSFEWRGGENASVMMVHTVHFVHLPELCVLEGMRTRMELA